MTASKVLSLALLGLIAINLTSAAPMFDKTVDTDVDSDVNTQRNSVSGIGAHDIRTKPNFVEGNGPITIDTNPFEGQTKQSNVGGNGNVNVEFGASAKSKSKSRIHPGAPGAEIIFHENDVEEQNKRPVKLQLSLQA